MDVPARAETLKFPERVVRLVKMNRGQIETLILRSDWVAEFRPAVAIASEVLRLDNRDQVELVRRLLERCEIDESSQVSVCVLDTGVNRGHPLLRQVVGEADLHAVREEWGRDDHEGHGSLMAGTVAYGNLLEAISGNGPLYVGHMVE